MKTITCLLLSPLALLGTQPTTDYTAERTLKVERVFSITSEVVDFVMVVDGEEREGGFGGGANERSLTITTLDTVLEHTDGVPTKVARTLESVSLEGSTSMGDEAREFERTSESEGLEIELTTAENGDVEYKVTEGDEPEGTDFGSLLLTQEIDALLPSEDVEAGDSWDLDADALIRGLGLGLERSLFGRPEPSGDRGERGERGGRRGGMRGGRGGLSGATLSGLDWEGEAKWTEETETVDDLECIVIELELEAQGTLPERERGGQEGRRGGGGGIWSPNTHTPPLPRETSVELELEGVLLWSLSENRAVSLTLKGDFVQDMERNMSRGDREMSISSSTEGEITIEVTITIE